MVQNNELEKTANPALAASILTRSPKIPNKIFGRPNPTKSTVRASGSKAHKAANPSKIEFHNQKQVSQKKFDDEKAKGINIVADVALGGVGKIPKVGEKLKNNMQNGYAKQRLKFGEMNSRLGDKVYNKLNMTKPGSWGDKITSRPVKVEVGKERMKDGTTRNIVREERVRSLTAPIVNTKEYVLPIAGSTYIFDKALGAGGEKPVTEVPVKEEFSNERLASVFEGGLFKTAALNKIAKLETERDELAGMIKLANYEKEILVNDNMKFQDIIDENIEKIAKVENELSDYKDKYHTLLEQFEKTAKEKDVDAIADNLLSKGIIKQADYNEMKEYLFSCDEQNFKMLQKVASSALGFNDSLMSIDDLGEDAMERKASINVSSKGQTISEAIRDLINK